MPDAMMGRTTTLRVFVDHSVIEVIRRRLWTPMTATLKLDISWRLPQAFPPFSPGEWLTWRGLRRFRILRTRRYALRRSVP